MDGRVDDVDRCLEDRDSSEARGKQALVGRRLYCCSHGMLPTNATLPDPGINPFVFSCRVWLGQP